MVSEPVRGTSGEFITLARVVKTQGRRGEVAAEIHTDVPDRFSAGMAVLALPPTGSASPEARRELSDLAGCTVFDHGLEIGRIADVQFGTGEASLLVVKNSAGQQFDIPFAEAYLEGMDLGRRQVRMNLPEGMLEINAPVTDEEKLEQARPAKRKGR